MVAGQKGCLWPDLCLVCLWPDHYLVCLWPDLCLARVVPVCYSTFNRVYHTVAHYTVNSLFGILDVHVCIAVLSSHVYVLLKLLPCSIFLGLMKLHGPVQLFAYTDMICIMDQVQDVVYPRSQ